MSRPAVYLIRHSSPQYHVDESGRRLVYGSSAGLTAEGRRRVGSLARNIRNRDSVPLDLIVTSPYERAKATAELLAQEMGMDRERVIIDDRLRDTQSTWAGVPLDEFMRVFDAGNTFSDPRTLETLEDLGSRMHAAYDYYINMPEYQEKNIGFVSHGNPLRALYFRLVKPGEMYPAYRELVEMMTLDAAEGLRIERESGDLERIGGTGVMHLQGNPVQGPLRRSGVHADL